MGNPLLINDMVFSRHLVQSALAVWPSVNDHRNIWHKYDDGHSLKYATKARDGLPVACRRLLDDMAELAIGRLLGERRAFPDYDLHGAGLHEIPPGGFLSRHVDAERHPIQSWERVASGVLFLNNVEGGELVIGDRSITPKENRLVLFKTEGVEHEVRQVRGDVSRKTLCLFWWRYSTAPQGSTVSKFLADSVG